MSTPPLFLVEQVPSAGPFDLTGAEGRHAARVKRLAVGEAIRIGDGRGRVASCVVSEVRADGLRLSVSAVTSVPAPSPRLVAVQALPKGERAELAVEVMTELGVDEIVPWAASRSIVRWEGPRGARALEKWRRTAAEAAKQSRQVRVPAVAELATSKQVAALLADATGLVLHESASVSLASAPLPSEGDVIIVIGPEGGVSDAELAQFAGAGAVAVRMGEPVLRTSTAGAAALAALSLRLGRWS